MYGFLSLLSQGRGSSMTNKVRPCHTLHYLNKAIWYIYNVRFVLLFHTHVYTLLHMFSLYRGFHCWRTKEVSSISLFQLKRTFQCIIRFQLSLSYSLDWREGGSYEKKQLKCVCLCHIEGQKNIRENELRCISFSHIGVSCDSFTRSSRFSFPFSA